MVKTKSNWRQYFSATNIVLIILFVYFLFLIRNDIWSLYTLNLRLNSLQISIQAEENLKLELEKKISLLDKNDYIEAIAREQLGLVKSGEKAYKVIKK